MAVDEKVEGAEPADADNRVGRALLRNIKRAAEKQLRLASTKKTLARLRHAGRIEKHIQPLGLGFGHGRGGNPARLPLLGIQQRHAPRGGLGPRAFLAVLVPNLHLPKRLLPGSQRLARIRDIQRLVSLDPSAVPEIALIGRQLLRGRGDKNAISGLCGTAARVRELP